MKSTIDESIVFSISAQCHQFNGMYFLRCVLLKHLRSDYDVYGNKTMPHSTLAGIRVYQVNRMSSVVCWVGFHLRSINLIA